VSKGRESAANKLRVYLAAYRMPAVKSDIFIILNVPEAFAAESITAGAPVQSEEAANEMIKRVVTSFAVKSLGIFKV